MTIVDLAGLGTLTVFLALRVYRCRFRAPDNMYDFMKEGHGSSLEVFQAVTLLAAENPRNLFVQLVGLGGQSQMPVDT